MTEEKYDYPFGHSPILTFGAPGQSTLRHIKRSLFYLVTLLSSNPIRRTRSCLA